MQFLEIFGVIIGLVYLYYEYRAERWVWLFSIVMPCISMVLYFKKGLYADFGINIYYLAIAIYGFIVWSKKTHKQKPAVPITHTPALLYPALIAATGIFWWLLWWLLTNFTNSTVPVPDAFTTALSIVALWMMARKYAEQWLAWIIVDAVCVGLYIYKGLNFYAFLYSVYVVVAIFGYRKWVSMIGDRHSQNS